MKVSGGLEEKGIVVGNTFDKYGSGNPLVRAIMNGFDRALSDLVTKAEPESLHEVGCGEGFWVLRWKQSGIKARGSDFSKQVIRLANSNAMEQGIDQEIFSVKSIYDLEQSEDWADLVVCCEVLEHLEDPEAGLSALEGVVGRYLIVSVPREPIWCFLNMARGKYLKDWGNTPGHLQNWSKRGFIRLVSKYFNIIEVRSPMPWTMLLCEKK